MSAVVIGVVDGKLSIRCKECKLVQFIGSNKKCRRCYADLEEKEPDPIIEAPPEPPPCVAPNGIGESVTLMLKILRDAHGFSQRDIAERLTIPRTYISKIERGHAMPNWTSLWRFCETFDIDPCWFLRLCEVAAGAQ